MFRVLLSIIQYNTNIHNVLCCTCTISLSLLAEKLASVQLHHVQQQQHKQGMRWVQLPCVALKQPTPAGASEIQGTMLDKLAGVYTR